MNNLPPGVTDADVDRAAGADVDPRTLKGHCDTCGEQLVRDPFSGSRWEPGEDLVCPECDMKDSSAGKCCDCGKPHHQTDGIPRCLVCRCDRVMERLAGNARTAALNLLAEAHAIDGKAVELRVRVPAERPGRLEADGRLAVDVVVQGVNWPRGIVFKVEQ